MSVKNNISQSQKILFSFQGRERDWEELQEISLDTDVLEHVDKLEDYLTNVRHIDKGDLLKYEARLRKEFGALERAHYVASVKMGWAESRIQERQKEVLRSVSNLKEVERRIAAREALGEHTAEEWFEHIVIAGEMKTFAKDVALYAQLRHIEDRDMEVLEGGVTERICRAVSILQTQIAERAKRAGLTVSQPPVVLKNPIMQSYKNLIAERMRSSMLPSAEEFLVDAREVFAEKAEVAVRDVRESDLEWTSDEDGGELVEPLVAVRDVRECDLEWTSDEDEGELVEPFRLLQTPQLTKRKERESSLKKAPIWQPVSRTARLFSDTPARELPGRRSLNNATSRVAQGRRVFENNLKVATSRISQAKEEKPRWRF